MHEIIKHFRCMPSQLIADKARTQDEIGCSQNNKKSPWMAITLTMLLLRVADFRATVSCEGWEGRRSLICTQSSALRTFVHDNKFKNHYKGQVTKLQVYETLDALQCKSHSGIGIYTRYKASSNSRKQLSAKCKSSFAACCS